MAHFGMDRRDWLRAGALRRINAARSPKGRHALSSFTEFGQGSKDAMLWEASTTIGYATVGSDGEVGRVSDLLFDDTTWRVRWIVVNTRHWFARREVVLPVSALSRLDPIRRQVAVDLTMRQIEGSPAAEEHPPVSQRAALSENHDPHLRSVEAVVGHRVRLLDIVVGHIEELLVDDAGWLIRYIRVDTCKWRPGDRVLLAPRSVREIDWAGRLVRFDVGCQELDALHARCDAIWIRSASHDTAPTDA